MKYSLLPSFSFLFLKSSNTIYRKVNTDELMNQLFYILAFLIIGNHLYSQSSRIGPPIDKYKFEKSVVDSATIRIYYAFNATDITDEKTYDDLQRLEIGAKLSRYYSYYLHRNDSLINDFMKKNTNAQSLPMQPGEVGKKGYTWSLLIWSDFFKDFSKNTLTEYATMPWNVPHYQYSEDLPVQEWELHDDTTTIAGYLCQKATCLFRGRNYVAWFASEIPVSNGPWKFGGLPGMILKVADEDQLYVFECIKIESHAKKYPIFIYDQKDFKKIEQAKLRQLDKAIYTNFYKVAHIVAKDRDGNPRAFIPIPYQPIELE